MRDTRCEETFGYLQISNRDSQICMWLIVGLGNPGERYRLTRHNIGFMVIDELAEQHHIRLNQRKYHAVVGSGKIDTEPVMLAKPITYMNRSGIAVAELLTSCKLDSSRLIIISDDFHLPLGTVRIRRQGSDGGHHGLQSIIENLATTQFVRVRIGIGEPSGEEVVDFVLSEFTEDELSVISDTVEKATRAVNIIIQQDIERAMNQFNKKDAQIGID